MPYPRRPWPSRTPISPSRSPALHKSFGKVHALRGIDFAVPRGSVLGMLGPNGAGKTTAVRVLTTLLRPDSGRVVIEGYDVVRDAAAVRRRIGLAGQATAIQLELTGRENLEIMGRLNHMPRSSVQRPRRRAARALRDRGRGRPSGQDVLGRHAATPRPRRQPDRRALRALPRRADHRPRSRTGALACGTSSASSSAAAPRCC